MASRPLGKPSFLEQVRAMKQACEESMVKDGSEVRPPTRVVPEDFKLWRTISLPMDQPVDEAALVRLREIYNAMQHLGVHMLACLDNTLPPELFKHIGVDHPPALLKKAIYEFLNK